MEELLLKILILSYAATSIIDIVGYRPTIKDLYHHKKESANIPSYLIWSITTGISFLYALFILPDILFRIVSGMTFLANFIVLILMLKLSGNLKEENKILK